MQIQIKKKGQFKSFESIHSSQISTLPLGGGLGILGVVVE